MIRVRAETNEVEVKRTIYQESMKQRGVFFKKINRIDKALAKPKKVRGDTN